jgi:hypothetical protein
MRDVFTGDIGTVQFTRDANQKYFWFYSQFWPHSEFPVHEENELVSRRTIP